MTWHIQQFSNKYPKAMLYQVFLGTAEELSQIQLLRTAWGTGEGGQQWKDTYCKSHSHFSLKVLSYCMIWDHKLFRALHKRLFEVKGMQNAENCHWVARREKAISHRKLIKHSYSSALFGIIVREVTHQGFSETLKCHENLWSALRFMKYENQKTAIRLEVSKCCFFFIWDVELAWNSTWEFAFISPYIQTLINSMVKRPDQPSNIQLLSSLNGTTGTRCRQGLQQEGTHPEKLPE